MNPRKRIGKKTLLLITLFFIVVMSSSVYSAPPTPQNVRGRVFYNDSTGVPNGVPVIVNNTAIFQIFKTQVFAPPIPSLRGSYALTINGSAGDLLKVTSFNNSMYGWTIAPIMANSTTIINVILNLARDSETNVTIISPQDNALFNSTDYFNVSVNISVLGKNALNCTITLSITDDNILNVTSNATNLLGSINIGQVMNTIFEVQAKSQGFANISAFGNCSTDGYNIEGLNIDILRNIGVTDITPPDITLVSPANLTVGTSSNALFQYSVNDFSNINNCSLIIGGVLNSTNITVTKNTTMNFSIILSNGNYLWGVECYDYFSNRGFTGYYNLTIAAAILNPWRINLTQNIILNAGFTKKIDCNVSFNYSEGAENITVVNATFYYIDNSTSTDDNNTHYTDNGCILTNASGFYGNYSCSFDVYYYANNGTWICEANAYAPGITANINNNTIILPIYALNISESALSYQEIEAGAYSPDVMVNITNLGNQPLNITVSGYGGNNSITGNGLAMICESYGNITIDNQRYAVGSGVNFLSKTPLSSSDTEIGFQIPKQTSADIQKVNSTYWQIYVPSSGMTLCQGSILFTAMAP